MCAKERARKQYYETPDVFVRGDEDPSKTNCIIGRSMSGKTHFMVQELNKTAGHKRSIVVNGHTIRRPMYDLILFMTESLDASPLTGLDPALNIKMLRGYYPKVIHLLKKIQDNTRNAFRFLVILDDIIDEKKIRQGTFVKQMCVMRNSHISTTILLQYPKMLPPAIRNSAHNLFFTGCKPEEWEYLLRSFMSSLAKEAVGNIGSIPRLSYEFKDFVGNNILHYDQRQDKISLIKRPPF